MREKENIMVRVPSYFDHWSARVVILLFGTLVVGCVAQQADVVRIKRELDAKINQLDKSKTSLQQAVSEANEALGNANLLIAQQRAEIKELLHARAEVMEQMATLKETDLSQVRGAIENNQHQVSELNGLMVRYDTEMKEMRTRLQQSEPLMHTLRDRLEAEEQLLTEQGGKLGEFRASLVDYQQVLSSIRQQVAQQEQQVVGLRKEVDRLGRKREVEGQHVQENFEEIRKSIQSVVGTLTKVSNTFGSRLDEHEHKLSRVAGQSGTPRASKAPVSRSSEVPAGSGASRSLLSSLKSSSPHAGEDRPPESLQQRAQSVDHGTGTAYPPASPVPGGLPALSEAPTTPSPGRADVGDPQVTYARALTLLRQGNFMDAAREFSGFVRTYPDSSLAANAQYWLGECYYGERRFSEAIDEFERVFALYPSSNKVPGSLLKIAYAHLELQQLPMARSVFHQLVRTYPQSPEADKAQDRLQEVNALLENPS
jgi:tol-pal system protein YbgF